MPLNQRVEETSVELIGPGATRTVGYIADLTAELAELAAKEGVTTLADSLEAVTQEARSLLPR